MYGIPSGYTTCKRCGITIELPRILCDVCRNIAENAEQEVINEPNKNQGKS